MYGVIHEPLAILVAVLIVISIDELFRYIGQWLSPVDEELVNAVDAMFKSTLKRNCRR